MFKSWSIEAGRGLTERRDDVDPDSGRKLILRACNHCRAKKLKCTGDPSGCQRCRDLLRTCHYDLGGIGRRHKLRSRIFENKNSTLYERDPHHGQRLFSLRADVETVTTPTDVDGRSTTGYIKLPGQQPGYTNQGPSQAQPSLDVQSQAPYCVTELSHSSSATGVSAEGWDAGNESIAPPYHSDDFLAAGGNTPSFPLDLVALENLHCEVQQFATQHPPMSTKETLPVNNNSLEVTAEVQGLGQRQEILAEAPHGSILVSNPPMRAFAPCLCLRRVILIMDEVEEILGEAAASTDTSASGYKFDIILATHREALRHAKTTLGCKDCAKSIETMIILTFLVEKLARICHRMVAGLGEKDPPDGSNIQPCGFGSYEVESGEEFRAVVSKLVELQLCGIRRLVKQLVGTSQRMDSGTMARRLAVTDELVSLAFSLLLS